MDDFWSLLLTDWLNFELWSIFGALIERGNGAGLN